VTQKKLRISPEDIDLEELRKRLKKKKLISEAKFAKKRLKAEEYVCGACIEWCGICLAVFPKGRGRMNCCPCDVYLKKDVAHVVEYLLLNLKI
jgi:hypothetical protein